MNVVHPPQPSSMKKWEDAPTRSADVAGARFVYRQLGPTTGVPAIMLNHWGAVLDNFDPRIVDGLAATRPVIALDYRGVGASSGKARLTVAEMAEDSIAFIRALDFEEVDPLGLSLGGFVAQDIVLKEPGLVRKVILTRTGPARGEGIEKVGAVSWPLIIKGMLTLQDHLFFTSTSNGRRSARHFLDRLKQRKADRDKPITMAAFLRQLKAIKAWGKGPPQDLGTIRKPVLVMAMTISWCLAAIQSTWRGACRIRNASFTRTPGTGGIFQYHEAFVSKTLEFLAR